MEAKNHLIYLKRALPFILVFTIAVIVTTFIIANRRPPSYQAIQTYTIALVNRAQTPDYQYGSYYDLKGAELFTQHAMSLLRSPALIEEIFQTAGVQYEIDNLNRFTSQFRTDQDSSQQFTVRFSRYTRGEAEALAAAMSDILTREVAAAHIDEAEKSLFALTSYAPVVIYNEVNVWLFTALGFVVGALCAIVLVYINRYLRS